MGENTFEEKLTEAPMIRLFLGVTALHEGDREQMAAAYKPSKIDRIYMEFPEKLTPCGKTRLKPELEFADQAGQTHIGVVLVPADKSDAILAGCSMQNGRLTPETAEAQRHQYALGHAAIRTPTAG